MARPRRKTYVMSQYMDNVKEGYISNDADTQRNPAWKPIINNLIVTVLTDDYMPPIILTEDDNSQLHIVDGGSRTAALRHFRYMNYKITSSVDDSIIHYKEKIVNENGGIDFRDAEFNIKGKTYEKLPKELKRAFDEYQLETVIHENCGREEIGKYVKRYNQHSGMNTNQKMFTYMPLLARQVRKIINMPFFIDYSEFTTSEKDKGILERTIAETIMCMYHLDEWKTAPAKIAAFLNNNSNEQELQRLEENLLRLEDIIKDDVVDIFNSKDTFIFLTLFERFEELGLPDCQFYDFLKKFKEELRENRRNSDGILFDEIDKKGSTKDKASVVSKLNLLTELMYEHLHILDPAFDVDTYKFVKNKVGDDISTEDMEQYEEVLDELVENIERHNKLLRKYNRPALVAIVAYSFKEDVDLDDWIDNYFYSNDTFSLNVEENYNKMKTNLENYIKKGAA